MSLTTLPKAGGILVMDLMHRVRAAHMYRQPIPHRGGLSETGHIDWVSGLRSATIAFGTMVKTFDVRIYTDTALIQLLQQTGFGHVDAYGDLHGGEVPPDVPRAVT
jgi:hypothetical protein